jgi:NDP-sugar pyrophosphorylase family protein
MKKPIFLVLAGGIGKNFAPLVTSKSVFPFFGQALITHTLEMIRLAGAKQAIVVCNADNEELIKKLDSKNLKIQTVRQNEASGQADAINLASELVHNQPVLIMNAVDLIDPKFLATFMKRADKTYAQIVGMKVTEYFLGGYLKVEGNRVTGIIEKPAKGQEPSDLANLFFHYFSEPQELFDLIKKQKNSDDAYEKALDQLMQKHQVEFMAYQGYWQKLKQAHQVLDMTQLFLKYKLKNKIARGAYVDRLAKIDGPVQIEGGAKILAGAVIKGPAYIGQNVIVGNHTLIRDSIIEKDSVIGFGSEVARSYVGPSCSLHHNFIGDSVLEAQVNPSYGTCTANLRFDGQAVKMRLPNKASQSDLLLETNKGKLGAIMARGVFLGVNCSILPGISLGENAKALPGSVIDRAVKAEAIFGKSN